jgi:integrase
VRKRTLTEPEIRSFWQGLEEGGFEDVTADALRLQLLLGARIHKVTGMVRSELALDQPMPLWTLPSARSKAAKDVPRPLPPMALEITQRRLYAAEGDFVFASPIKVGMPIIPKAPTRALRRAAHRELVPAGFTPHDLRRTCRTFWAKLGISETVAKKILGHAPMRSDVTASVYD